MTTRSGKPDGCPARPRFGDVTCELPRVHHGLHSAINATGQVAWWDDQGCVRYVVRCQEQSVPGACGRTSYRCRLSAGHAGMHWARDERDQFVRFATGDDVSPSPYDRGSPVCNATSFVEFNGERVQCVKTRGHDVIHAGFNKEGFRVAFVKSADDMCDVLSLSFFRGMRLRCVNPKGHESLHTGVFPDGDTVAFTQIVDTDKDPQWVHHEWRRYGHPLSNRKMTHVTPKIYKGVPVPEDLRNNWGEPEAIWWRHGVKAALDHIDISIRKATEE